MKRSAGIFIAAGLASCPVLESEMITCNRPNILWITCEDISPSLGCYGDKAAITPVLDRLASEGMLFTNAFAVSGVSAPSRSCIITGMYPTSIGTHHMRTAKDVTGNSGGVYLRETGLFDPEGNLVPQYSAVIPDNVKCFTEYLRIAGYYCTNNAKTDYQFASPISAWDENGNKAHWRNRPEGKPFFSVFNLNVSHESQIWQKKNDSLWIDPSTPLLPPYFPENPVIRQDVARNYSNISEMDAQVGKILAQLDEDGLTDNTIVFFFSDHGGPLPRGKREIYDSGLHVPLIVRFPGKENSGMVIIDLISFVDLAPTVLSLAGIKPPDYLQGQSFLGEFKEKPRTEIFGARDRMDEQYDRVRCVRDKNYLYVRNYYPDLPNYMDISYRKQMDMMNELLRLRDMKMLNRHQYRWFETEKPMEELYDVTSDPYQLSNLVDDPGLRPVLEIMRAKLEKWQHDFGDMGEEPEGRMIEKMWPRLEQPQTARPVVSIKSDKMTITSSTPGASVVYQVSTDGISRKDPKYWFVYSCPLKIPDGIFVHAIAERIGYMQSEETTLKIQ